MSSPIPSDGFFCGAWRSLMKEGKRKAKMWLWSGGKQRREIEEAEKWGENPNNNEKQSKNIPPNQHKYNNNNNNKNNYNDGTTTSTTTK